MKRTLSYRDRQTRWLTENNVNAKETRVIVKRGLEESDYEWELTWIMDNYVGVEGLVRDVKNVGIVVTFPDGDSFCFPYYVLEKVNDEKKEEIQSGTVVLVRNHTVGEWQPDIYVTFDKNGTDGYYHVCVNSVWRAALPFKGNEHLLGTTKCGI